MEKDMHFYATYVASKLAGYNRKDANIIAYSAQFVDDFTLSRLNEMVGDNNIFERFDDFLDVVKSSEVMKKELGIDFDLILTSQSFAEVMMTEIRSVISEDSSDLIRKIWTIFHFLPGNLNNEMSYNGDKSVFLKDYSEEEEWDFNLLCLNSSKMVDFMINDLVNYKDIVTKNYLTGIRMHVLIDTWAHKWYSGTPSWWVNEIKGDILYLKDGKYREVEWDEEEHSPNPVDFLPGAKLFCMGHSRSGHLPDLPWIKYKYKPQWNSEKDYIVKDNVKDFTNAIKQMIVALKSVKENKKFDVKDLNPRIDDKIMSELVNIISTKQELNIDTNHRLNKRCKLWENYIKNNIERKDFEDYDKEKWDLKSIELRNFQLAAKYHLKSIKIELKNNYGLDLNKPGKRLVNI